MKALVLAVLVSLAAVLPMACASASGNVEVIEASTTVAPARFTVAEGIDTAEATRRIAAAAADLLAQEAAAPPDAAAENDAPQGTSRLMFRNRRLYELRVRVDAEQKHAWLSLSRGGVETHHLGLQHDLQLAHEYGEVVRRARVALNGPAALPAEGAVPAEGAPSAEEGGGEPASEIDGGALDGGRKP